MYNILNLIGKTEDEIQNLTSDQLVKYMNLDIINTTQYTRYIKGDSKTGNEKELNKNDYVNEIDTIESDTFELKTDLIEPNVVICPYVSGPNIIDPCGGGGTTLPEKTTNNWDNYKTIVLTVSMQSNGNVLAHVNLHWDVIPPGDSNRQSDVIAINIPDFEAIINETLSDGMTYPVFTGNMTSRGYTQRNNETLLGFYEYDSYNNQTKTLAGVTTNSRTSWKSDNGLALAVDLLNNYQYSTYEGIGAEYVIYRRTIENISINLEAEVRYTGTGTDYYVGGSYAHFYNTINFDMSHVYLGYPPSIQMPYYENKFNSITCNLNISR